MARNRAFNGNRAWAILFARLVLGLIFFMPGAWKVFPDRFSVDHLVSKSKISEVEHK